jgi:nitroimidazol reductase NimA-like FMN-containing flavoprotein (pyridoxamine 5'-phosphate oxidase superfamily)
VTTGAAERWWSVVAQGRLEPIEDVEDSAATLDSLHRADIPIVDIFPVPEAEVTFEYHRLAPEELTARQATSGSGPEDQD